MVKINSTKLLFGALVLTCGASVVYAQNAGGAAVVANAAEGKTLSDTLKGVSTPVATGNVKPAAEAPKNAADKAKAVGKATEFGADPSVMVENSAPAAAGSEDPFAAVRNMPVPNAGAQGGVNAAPAGASSPVSVAKAFEGLDAAADAPAADKSAMPSEQLLGPIDSDVFKEMADIERETALLSLKVKRDRLLADVEKAKADRRKNQMDEMERREQMVRDRVKWEIEQEDQAKARAKADAEARAEEARSRLKEEEPGSVFEDEEDITLVYTIREIKGINGELVAVLNSERGAFDATIGYPLKNGFKVAEITPSGVKIKRGADVALLLFSETGTVSSSSAPRSGRQSGQRSSSSSSKKSSSKSSSSSDK